MAKINLARPEKQRRFPVWIVAVAVILCLCVAVALLWQPVMTALVPEAALTVAVANTVAQAALRLTSPLTDCVTQAAGYVQNGSMDAEITLKSILSNMSYRLTTTSDPENRRQASSYHVTALELTTDIETYLDADCAAFSMDLLTGGDYYGITFDTYASDLEKADFYPNLSNKTLASFHDFVAELDAVYPNENTRTAGLELPSIEAPDWLRTLLAYVTELDFEGSDAMVTLDGSATECSAITTRMDSRYAANMFLDALETVSSNIFLASSLYSDDDGEQTPELQEKLEYYRDNTEGNVILVAYLYQNALVAVDLEWEFTANHGTLDISDTEILRLNLGANPSESDWKLELKQSKGASTTASEYAFICRETQYALVEYRTENGSTSQTYMSLQWDEASGLVTLDMTKSSGTETLSASTNGTILRTDSEVSVNIAGLYDFFKIATLPSFLQGIDLGLVSDASVVATFSAETDIVKPEYVNLDQWELPWLLDLFL